jgi:hypothetical protein
LKGFARAAGFEGITRATMKRRLVFAHDGRRREWRYTTPASGGGVPVLAFDIETTGLDAETCEVTCACAYDPDRGVERSFVFSQGGDPAEFMALLDDAPLLCAFNGVRFDLPFLARRWGVPDEKVGSWVRKMVDPFEGCKLALGQTFSLNRLLSENGLPVKTSSGLEAVKMAREGRWAELAEYCMHDTKMTHAAVTLAGGMLLPRRV